MSKNFKTIGKAILLPLRLIGILVIEIIVLLIRLYQWAYEDWGRY